MVVAGKRLRAARVAIAAASLVAMATGGFYACVFNSATETDPNAEPTGAGPSTGAQTSSLSKQELLTSLGENVFVPTLKAFAEDAAALEVACAELAATPDDSAKWEAAQSSWTEAMAQWQRAEVMQLGPAGSMGSVAGGEDMRDEIYSYPVVNACRVDQEIVAGDYAEPATFADELVNVRGLDALERLLFHAGTGNACAPQNDINQTGSWDAIASELPARRADYAATAAKLLSDRADALVGAWEGSFLDELRQAGQGSGIYDSEQAALNAISDAMFYLDTETKDMKLAVPTGLSDCAAETCPGNLELATSRSSKAAIVDNLEGFREVFTGGPRGQADLLGFDDWLIGVGSAALAIDMVDRIDAAVAAADAIEQDDLAAALGDPEGTERTRDLYHAVKAVTDLLKADVVTLLDLELPQAAEGDND